MSDTFEDLYNQFQAFVEKNDEQGARDFLVNNLQKFPEDVQEKLTFAFFEEAVTEKAQGIQAIAEMQQEGLDAINQIDRAKKILEDKQKIEDLRSDLTK